MKLEIYVIMTSEVKILQGGYYDEKNINPIGYDDNSGLPADCGQPGIRQRV